MKIGIIGAGNIGHTLGEHWVKAGHEVFFSSRHPQELKMMADRMGAQSGSVSEALNFGEVILLAVPFKAIEGVGGRGKIAGKILIDATNPYPSRDGVIAQNVIDDKDLTSTEYTTRFFPGAKVVKAFNSVFYKTLEDKAFRQGDERIAVHIAGNDPQAKQKVKQLIEDIGMAPMDMGSLKHGKYFEPGQTLYNTNLTIKDATDLWNEIGKGGSGRMAA